MQNLKLMLPLYMYNSHEPFKRFSFFCKKNQMIFLYKYSSIKNGMKYPKCFSGCNQLNCSHYSAHFVHMRTKLGELTG